MKKYIIVRVLSNNVVLCNENQREYILMGKGLGFKAKANDFVPEEKIERCFLALNPDDLQQYEQLISTVPQHVVDVAESVIEFIESSFNKELDSRIHISLTDHINFLITRLNEGMEIRNPLLEEIAILYKNEYMVAQKAIMLLEQKLDLSIPKDEIGFIALHIHSSLNNQTTSERLKYTKICHECVEIIESHTNKKMDKCSINYIRLITHLRFAIERVILNEQNKNELLGSIKRSLKKEFKLAKIVAKHIEQRVNKKVGMDEVGYLAIHINRVTEN